MVVLSHIGYRIDGYHLGVPAVVCFYMLSGYFVAFLYERNSTHTYSSHWVFYRDRMLRIFPLYFFVTILTIVFMFISRYAEMVWTPVNIMANLTIVPLNYYMYIPSVVLPTLRYWLVPPAWSLGVEIQFYLLLPFFARNDIARRTLLLGSYAIFWLGAFGVLDTVLYTYRLVPGTVFIFITGMLLFYEKTRREAISIERYAGWIVWAVACIGWIALYSVGRARVPYITEVLFGIIVGYPLIRWLVWKAPLAKWDDMLGSLAYGVFLGHFLIIWAYSYSQNKVSEMYVADLRATTVILIGSFILSLAGYVAIDRPLRIYRRGLRARR